MKRYSVLIGILVVVALAYVFLVDPGGWFKPDEAASEKEDPDRRVLCDFTESDVTAFAIIKPDGETFRLEKQGGEWLLVKGDKTYKAKMDRVEKLLEEVPGLKAEGRATDKRDKHASFEVDEANGIRLDVYTGGESPSVELMIGKATSGFKGAFVRYFDADEVYRASKNVKSPVGFEFNDYRTRKPWSCEPTSVTSVTVRQLEGDKDGQAFTREDGIWKTTGGDNANQNMLTELVDKFSKLTISSFIEATDEDTAAFAGLAPHLMISTPEDDYTLTIGEKNENKFNVSDHDGLLYKITEGSLKFYLDLDFDKLSFDDTAAEEEADEAQEPPAE